MSTAHQDMDETGEHATRLHTSDGGYRLDTRRPMPMGCDYQGRYPQAAEACTELGADDEAHVSGAISWPVYAVLAALAVVGCWNFVAVVLLP